MGAEARLSLASLSVVPGESGELEVTVRNNGTVVDQFGFDVVGIPNDWASFEPPSVSLFPATEQTVRLTIAPPRAPTTAPGAMPFGVRVSSTEDPAGSTVEEATLWVGAFSDVVGELVPHAARGRFRAKLQLAVDNRSNIAYRARPSGLDPDEAVGLSFQPPYVEVEPGSVSFTRVGLRAHSRLWRGSSVTRAFQVLLEEQGAINAAEAGAAGQYATPEGSVHPPSILLDGVMLQDPILPSWILKALLALLLLAIAAVILWFNLLKPQIQAAAQNQVTKQLAAAGITTTPTTVPPTTTATGGGGTTPKGGGGTHTGGGGSTVGLTINRSLLVSGNTTATYTVPKGQILEITDVLVENTAGTTGVVQLSGNGVQLMQWAMADFRDLDYHWITPTTFASSTKVQFGLSGCKGTCSAGLYFAGSLDKA